MKNQGLYINNLKYFIISVPTFFRGEGAEIALNLYQKFSAPPKIVEPAKFICMQWD